MVPHSQVNKAPEFHFAPDFRVNDMNICTASRFNLQNMGSTYCMVQQTKQRDGQNLCCNKLYYIHVDEKPCMLRLVYWPKKIANYV